MERDFCIKCGGCCKKIAVDFSKNIMFRDGIQNISADFSSMLIPLETKENITLCTCKYLRNNICTNINKPNECIEFPSSPFAFLPEGCGFYGAVFLEREKFMQHIRKLEEEILHYEALIQSCSKDDAKQYSKIICRHKSFIEKYKVYFL